MWNCDFFDCCFAAINGHHGECNLLIEPALAAASRVQPEDAIHHLLGVFMRMTVDHHIRVVQIFFVPGDKLNDFGCFLTGFLHGFGRSLGRLDRVVRGLSGLGLGIGFLNGALLLEPGDRACAPFRILKLRFLVQRPEIGPVSGALRFQRSGMGAFRSSFFFSFL